MANYFTDRIVQHPGRVTMTPVAGQTDTYDLARAEGTVTEEGTPFNAATFNSIADELINDVPGRVWYGTCPTAATGTTDKIVTVDSGFTLQTGVAIAVKFDNACVTSTSVGNPRNLNVNGTGAIPVSVKGMTTMTYNPWSAGDVVLFVYDETYWQMLSTPTVNNLNSSFRIGNMLIQFGNVTTTANANAYTDTSVTFPTAYSSAPAVFLTTLSTSTAAAFADVEICLAGVTTRGFTIRGFNNSASSRSPAVRWLAIGTI